MHSVVLSFTSGQTLRLPKKLRFSELAFRWRLGYALPRFFPKVDLAFLRVAIDVPQF
jgi:hypothetical protein